MIRSISTNAIPLYSTQNGVVSGGITYTPGYYAYEGRTDTVRRKKPADLFANATSVYSERIWTRDAPLQFTWYNANPVYYPTTVTYTSVGSRLPSGRPFLISSISVTDNELDNKLRAKLRSASVNLANMLGEYRKTAKLFGDTAKLILKMVYAARHADPRILIYQDYVHRGRRAGLRRAGFTARQVRNLSQIHLAFMYGVKPLMKDLSESVEVLRKRCEQELPPVVVSASVRKGTGKNYLQNSYPALYFKDGKTIQGAISEGAEVTLSGTARATLSNTLLNQSFGRFGLTNVPSVVWELTPFSFVVDWWINIGEFLASLDNHLYFQNAKVVRTRTEREFRVCNLLGSESSTVYLRRSRSIAVGLDTVSWFRYKESISATHIANGTALLAQLYSNRVLRK